MKPAGTSERNWKFLSDIYTTLIEIKWRWNILIFVSGLVITWFLFACIFYILCYLHGDMEGELPNNFKPCLQNVKTLTAAYLFSIETMTTIGYGHRYQTEECPEIFLLVMLQSIIGAGLQFALASLVVSKTRRAKWRSETILFSDQVCIYEQDAQLHLAVRVCDMRKADISGAHAEGYLIKKFKSNDGSFVPVRYFRVQFSAESGREEIFFPFPTQIIHVVDKYSPLWSLSRDELLDDQYELIVVLDGVCSSTCRPFQARRSYHSAEMIWGQRFANLDLTFSSGGHCSMDMRNFYSTVPAITPLLSAENITNLREIYNARAQQETRSRGSSTSEITPTPHHQPPPGRPRGREHVPHLGVERRYSLGDMIRVAHGRRRFSAQMNSFDDALNLYKHRPSITDTYLGTGINEEEVAGGEEDNAAILSLVTRQSSVKKNMAELKESFKRRRSSGTVLMFKTSTEDETFDSSQDDDDRRGAPEVAHPPGIVSPTPSHTVFIKN
ncbi:Inward rectifier potassium channel 2 [Bulinus truncatus]|nr:Inward rectifier potassium channel 2 [Bulinus truncatus]